MNATPTPGPWCFDTQRGAIATSAGESVAVVCFHGADSMAREHAKSPDDFAQFHVGNLVSCAADHADSLYDLLLQAALPAIHAQQSSGGDAA